MLDQKKVDITGSNVYSEGLALDGERGLLYIEKLKY